MLRDGCASYRPLPSVGGGSQPSGLNTRTPEGGNRSSLFAGLIGRGSRPPPQFGQRPPSLVSTQSRQNVHSKLQIIASGACGGRSLLQHSQLGRSSSTCILLSMFETPAAIPC
jgi:hypothetical protein